MSIPGEYISTLTELGLSVLQVKVYLSLSKFNCLTAHQIANASGVARSDIYRVLAELEKEGFVERIIEKPERFHPISMDKFIANLLRRRISKTEELQRKTHKLAINFRKSFIPMESGENFQCVLISGRAAVYSKAENILRNVQECICFMGLRKRMIAWLSNFLPLVEEALARKVIVRIILPNDESHQSDWGLSSLGKYSTFYLKTIQGNPKAGFSVWDRKEVLISTSTMDTTFPQPTLWSNNTAIVAMSQDYFETVWKNAKKSSREKFTKPQKKEKETAK
jgi:sugar-specific transcriptional regulator TrmB